MSSKRSLAENKNFKNSTVFYKHFFPRSLFNLFFTLKLITPNGLNSFRTEIL